MTDSIGYQNAAKIMHPYVSQQFKTVEDLNVDILQNYINEPMHIKTDKASGLFLLSPSAEDAKNVSCGNSVTLLLYANFAMAVSVFEKVIDVSYVPMVFINTDPPEILTSTVVKVYINDGIDISEVICSIYRLVSFSGLYIAIKDKDDILAIPNVYDFLNSK